MFAVHSTKKAPDLSHPTAPKELNAFASFIKEWDLEGLRTLLNSDSNAHEENRPHSYEWRKGELAFDLAHTVIAQRDDLEMVKVILENPQRITPREYISAVQEAVRHNRVAILAFLLPTVDANLFSAEIMILLDYAIRQGYVGIVELLLKDPEKVTDKYKALEQAMSCYLPGKNNAEPILELFLNNPNLVSVEDRGTAVEYAAWRSKLALLQLLLAGHANISSEARKNAISTVMINPTELTSSRDTWGSANRLEALALLLEDGSQLSPKDRGDLIKELLDPRSRWVALDEANRLWFLKRLLADHAPILPQDRIEAVNLALKTSCSTEQNRIDILETLLENQADNSSEVLQEPIFTAIEFSRKEALEFLLDRLENPFALFCFNALQCAVRAHQQPALESLLALLPIPLEVIAEALAWIDKEECFPGQRIYRQEYEILDRFQQKRTVDLQEARKDALAEEIRLNDLNSIHPPIGNSNKAIEVRDAGVLEAVRQGSVDALKLLLANQAIISDHVRNQALLLTMAGHAPLQNTHLELLRLLKDHPSVNLGEAIAVAARRDSLDCMRILLEQQDDINSWDRKRALLSLVGRHQNGGNTVITGQVSTHLPEMLQLLLRDQDPFEPGEGYEFVTELMFWNRGDKLHRMEALKLFLENTHPEALSIATKERLIWTIVSQDNLELGIFEGDLEILQILLAEGSGISPEVKNAVIAVAKEQHWSQLFELLKVEVQTAAEIHNETSDSDQSDSTITPPTGIELSGPTDTQQPSMTPTPTTPQPLQEPIPQIHSPSWTERIEQAWNWFTRQIRSLIDWIFNL